MADTNAVVRSFLWRMGSLRRCQDHKRITSEDEFEEQERRERKATPDLPGKPSDGTGALRSRAAQCCS